jgi:hypothetical protein
VSFRARATVLSCAHLAATVLDATVLDLFYPSFPCFCRASTAINLATLFLFPLALHCLPPCDHLAPSRRRAPFAEIRHADFTPSQFPWPVAPPPPYPAPGPNPTQFPTPLRWNCSHPDPPLTGAARARLHRRQLSPPNLGLLQVYRSLPGDPLMLVRVFLVRVHRPSAGNAGASPRPPHPPVVSPIPLLPIQHPLFLCTP